MMQLFKWHHTNITFRVNTTSGVGTDHHCIAVVSDSISRAFALVGAD